MYRYEAISWCSRARSEFEHVDVDPLTASRPIASDQGGQDAVDDVEPSGEIGHPDPGRRRRILVAPAEAREAGQRLDEEVLPGPTDVGAILTVPDARA